MKASPTVADFAVRHAAARPSLPVGKAEALRSEWSARRGDRQDLESLQSRWPHETQPHGSRTARDLVADLEGSLAGPRAERRHRSGGTRRVPPVAPLAASPTTPPALRVYDRRAHAELSAKSSSSAPKSTPWLTRSSAPEVVASVRRQMQEVHEPPPRCRTDQIPSNASRADLETCRSWTSTVEPFERLRENVPMACIPLLAALRRQTEKRGDAASA